MPENMTRRLPAREVIARLVDDARELDLPGRAPNPLGWPGYEDRLRSAAEETGLDEAVIVARGRVAGSETEAVFAVWDFRFLGGSVGPVVGERIARAYEAATNARLPIVLLPSTGGSRMQEGMASLSQMAKTSVAARRHADAGLIQVSWLRDPTTGGVFASHANLADIVLAEPGATIGFAGPRVAEAMTGGPLPEASHTSQGARSAGLVDAVVGIDDLPRLLGPLLTWPGETRRDAIDVPDGERTEPGDAWTQVQRARAVDRPRAGDYLNALDLVFELHGDRAGGDDPTVRVGCAYLAGRPIVVVALDRRADGGRVTPSGYRKAWRGLRLATQVGVPVVTLIDTPGADASASSEAGGVAHHIARTFSEVLATPTPIVSLTIGEGGSGGALALSVGDRLLIEEHAIFSVIAPEGAAAILHRDSERAEEVAELLKPTARDLADLGIADEVVPEPAGGIVAAGLAAIARHLDDLARIDPVERLHARHDRWREVVGGADA